jgi:hypothetical protein
MNGPTTFNLSEHVLNKAASCFDRPTLEALADLHLDPEALALVDDLASKANEGLLSEEERGEYRAYIETSELLALVQLRARQQLGLPIPAE